MSYSYQKQLKNLKHLKRVFKWWKTSDFILSLCYLVSYLHSKSIVERLKILNLQSLEHRRLQFDLVTYFKIVHTHLCLEAKDFFTFSPNNRSRGHPYRLIVPLVKSNIKKHFFSCRVVHPWNTLPSTLVTNPNIIHFKSRLKQINLNKFLIQPSIIPI